MGITLKQFFYPTIKLAIHCNTKKQKRILFKKFDDMGKTFLNRDYYLGPYGDIIMDISDTFTNYGAHGDYEYFKDDNTIKVFEFYEVEDFNPPFVKYIPIGDDNTNTILGKKITKNLFTDTPKINKPKNNFFSINRLKKTVHFEYNGDKITIKCAKEDKFDWKIGLGLAISKIGAIGNKKTKFHRELLRNEKTHKLNYKKYSMWCLYEFFGYYKEPIKSIDLSLKLGFLKDNKKIKL